MQFKGVPIGAGGHPEAGAHSWLACSDVCSFMFRLKPSDSIHFANRFNMGMQSGQDELLRYFPVAWTLQN